MTKYTMEQKLDAVIQYQNSSVSMKEIAERIGTSKSVIHNWIKQYEYHGLSAFEKSINTTESQMQNVRQLDQE